MLDRSATARRYFYIQNQKGRILWTGEERLKEEYSEVKERYEKLKAYNTKLKVKLCTSRRVDISAADSYRCDLLRAQ